MRRFEATEDGSAKFWEVEVAGAELTVRFGKLGTSGQSKVKTFDSATAAQAEADKLVREKTKKGYVEVGGEPAAVAATSAPPKAAPAAPADAGSAEVPPELALFRAAKKAFFGSSDFGEVEFLRDGAVPPMVESQPGEALWTVADWVAAEADGAILGFLRVPGAPRFGGPVVHIDNEGQLRLSGATLVDHFGSQTRAAADAELGPLQKFCEKHGLPGWRSKDTVRALAKAAGLDALDRDPSLARWDAEAWAREVKATQPGAPKKPEKPKARKGVPKRPIGKKDQSAFRAFVDREGRACVIEPGVSGGSTVWTFDGDRVEPRTVPGYLLAVGYDGTDTIELAHDGARLSDGRPVALPEGLAFGDSFSSHRTGPLYARGESGAFYRWKGTSFEAEPRLPASLWASWAREPGGGIVLAYASSGDAKLTLVRLRGESLEPLPSPPEYPGVHPLRIVRGQLVLVGGSVHVLDEASGTWRSSPAFASMGSRWAGVLGDELVVVQADDRRLHAIDVGTLASRVLGRLPFVPTMNHAIVFDGHDRVVMAGGTVDKYGALQKVGCEPTVWEKGEVRALAGCEVELEACLAAHAKRAFTGLESQLFRSD